MIFKMTQQVNKLEHVQSEKCEQVWPKNDRKSFYSGRAKVILALYKAKNAEDIILFTQPFIIT